MEKAKEYLDKLIKIQPIIKVQSFIKFPAPWIDYNPDSKEFKEYVEKYGFPNHREILTNEVVIDVDADNKEDGKRHSDLVEAKLKLSKLYYKRYESGGTGEHFHLVFNDIPYLLGTDYHRDRIKYLLIEYILKDNILNPPNLQSHVCLANKKLIQIEYAMHRKGNTKRLVSGDIRDNKIPDGFKEFIERWMEDRSIIQKRINLLPEQKELNCIKFFEGNVINGKQYFKKHRLNYRAVFLMCSYYHIKTNGNKEELLKIILDWYNSIPKGMRNKSREIDEKLIKNTVKLTKGYARCMYRMDLLREIKCQKVCDGCPYYSAVTGK